MDSDQHSLHWTDEPQLAENDRTDDGICCPDCGDVVSATKGMHTYPTDDGDVLIHGWRCRACNNVLPANCHDADAPGYIAGVVGLKLAFRDGDSRWVPVSKSSR